MYFSNNSLIWRRFSGSVLSLHDDDVSFRCRYLTNKTLQMFKHILFKLWIMKVCLKNLTIGLNLGILLWRIQMRKQKQINSVAAKMIHFFNFIFSLDFMSYLHFLGTVQNRRHDIFCLGWLQ